MHNQILTISQAAKILQVDPNTIYRWARAGKFPASKIGKEWRILYGDILAFIEKHKRKHELFTNEQTAELITALAGRRELPLKFQYLGKGADRFVSFEHTSEYGVGQTEVDLILDNEEKIMSRLSKHELSVLDMGCGDGKKAAAILTRLGRYSSQDKLNYFPIDISERMLDIAIDNVKLAHDDINIEQFKEDFEKGNISKITYYLRRRYQRDNIILLLGQTIGNIADSHRVLINLRDSMTEKEALLVGMALLPKKNPLEGYDQEIIYDWLWTVPEKIGITRENADIKLSFNFTKHQIEYKLDFKKNWSKNYGNDLLSFHKGQKILIAVSHKFTKDEIFSLFASAGFKIELLLESKENNYCVVLCKPYSWER